MAKSTRNAERKALYTEFMSMTHTTEGNITLITKSSEAKLMFRLHESLMRIQKKVNEREELTSADTFEVFVNVWPRFFMADKKADTKNKKKEYDVLIQTDNAPPKPLSAFAYFCKDETIRNKVKRQLKSEGKPVLATSVTKILSELWKSDTYRDYSTEGSLTDSATKLKYDYTAEALVFAKMRAEAVKAYNSYCESRGIQTKKTNGTTKATAREKKTTSKLPITIFIEDRPDLVSEYEREFIEEQGGKQGENCKRYVKSRMQTAFTLLPESEKQIYKNKSKATKVAPPKKDEAQWGIDELQLTQKPSPQKPSPIDDDEFEVERKPSKATKPRVSVKDKIEQALREQASQEQARKLIPSSESINSADEMSDAESMNGFDDDDEDDGDIFDYNDDDESEAILRQFGLIE